MEKVNLAQKLALFGEHWSPRIVADVNDCQVKLAKFQGEFVWHQHDHEDELFLVLEGRLRMDFRDRQVWLERGELIVVPRGVEHRPHTDAECRVLLVEPRGVFNTGDAGGALTAANDVWA